MTKTASSQQPASLKPYSATAISSDTDSAESLWMKRTER